MVHGMLRKYLQKIRKMNNIQWILKLQLKIEQVSLNLCYINPIKYRHSYPKSIIIQVIAFQLIIKSHFVRLFHFSLAASFHFNFPYCQLVNQVNIDSLFVQLLS